MYKPIIWFSILEADWLRSHVERDEEGTQAEIVRRQHSAANHLKGLFFVQAAAFGVFGAIPILALTVGTLVKHLLVFDPSDMFLGQSWSEIPIKDDHKISCLLIVSFTVPEPSETKLT